MIVEGPVMMGSSKSQCPCTQHLRGTSLGFYSISHDGVLKISVSIQHLDGTSLEFYSIFTLSDDSGGASHG